MLLVAALQNTMTFKIVVYGPSGLDISVLFCWRSIYMNVQDDLFSVTHLFLHLLVLPLANTHSRGGDAAHCGGAVTLTYGQPPSRSLTALTLTRVDRSNDFKGTG